MPIRIKRIYEEPQPDDGFRVLVDRLWPRGISKQRASTDIWLKDIAPSSELRQWFGHRVDRFDAFARQYEAELDDNPAVHQLRAIVSAHPTVTLLYGAKEETANNAVVLAGYLTAEDKS
jgi:uncharacterized protein YeaO (DUF488 family)